MKRSSTNSTQQDVTLDLIFDALSQQRRRQILSKVARNNPRDEDEFNGEDEDPEQSLASNFHTHLPKLDDAGFIEWDQEDGTVMRGPRFEAIEPLLELMDEHEDELPDDWP
ncbi:ArsR family transcriptional regulator [Haladaptatus sp. W1]|uniref:DUF7344 domain-containing protein n=1 Tax=Haladaptatus sp. W1 TaxID=1897478 RepID=UPI0020C7FB8E|nr:ArsR family transcriptional regulator [Haladaptatus sp. W1]